MKSLLVFIIALLTLNLHAAAPLTVVVTTNTVTTIDPVYLNSNTVQLVSVAPTNCSAVLTNNQIRFTATNSVSTNFIAYSIRDLYTNLSTNTITVYTLGATTDLGLGTNITSTWNPPTHTYIYRTNVFLLNPTVSGGSASTTVTASTNYGQVVKSVWNLFTFRYELVTNVNYSQYTVTRRTNTTTTGRPANRNYGPLTFIPFTTNCLRYQTLNMPVLGYIVDTNGFAPRLSASRAVNGRSTPVSGVTNLLRYWPRSDFTGVDTVAVTVADNTYNVGYGIVSVLVSIPPPYIPPGYVPCPVVTTTDGNGAADPYGTNKPLSDVYVYRGDTTRLSFTNITDPSGITAYITNVVFPAGDSSFNRASITITPTNVGNADLAFGIANLYATSGLVVLVHVLNHDPVFTNQIFVTDVGSAVTFNPSNYLYYVGKTPITWSGSSNTPTTFTPTSAGLTTFAYGVYDGYTSANGTVLVLATNNGPDLASCTNALFPFMVTANNPTNFLVTGGDPGTLGFGPEKAITGSGSYYAIPLYFTNDVFASNAWVQMKLPYPVNFTGYAVDATKGLNEGVNSRYGGLWGRYALQASTDGTNWDTCDSQYWDAAFIDTYGLVTNSVTSTNAYRYVKLVINNNLSYYGQNGEIPTISGFQLFGCY